MKFGKKKKINIECQQDTSKKKWKSRNKLHHSTNFQLMGILKIK